MPDATPSSASTRSNTDPVKPEPVCLCTSGWRLVHVLILAVGVLVAGSGLMAAHAQSTSPAVEADPLVPTESGSVTIFFNADEGDGGLADFTGDVWAHTGVYTTSSPNEWTCVKNYWPTESLFSGNRSDTQLTRISANRYRLDIDNIRDFYDDGQGPECQLAAADEITSMNVVFRNEDGSVEGKASGGDDIFVELGDADAAVQVTFTSPTASFLSPLVTDQDETVTVEASASTSSGAMLQNLRLLVDGTEVQSSTTSPISYDLSLNTPGRYDLKVIAEADDGSTASDSLYAVRVAPPNEAPVPSGLEDGINYTGPSSATLVLQAPGKEYVHVIGEFTDWEVDPNFQMNRASNAAPNGTGTRYWIEIDGLTSGQEYGFQYLVDGDIRIADPYSDKVLSTNDRFIPETTYPDLKPYPEGRTEQLVSVLETGQTPFSFSAFERPEQKDLVIYELLIRDFIEDSNYQTMQDTLGYLKDLGVNAIELMPVSEFDGNLSWGYNPALYFAPDKFYGPREELKQFIDLAHQEGIAIILDVVYNQATGQNPFVRLYNEGTFGSPTPDNPWVNPEARHPFNVFNDNNHESAFTQYWLDRANEHWLTEYNVDGFRFDLSKGFTQTDTGDDVGAWSSYDQSRIDLLTRMADEIWGVDDRAYVILEHFAETSEEKVLAEYRTGEGLPGMMLWNNQHFGYNEASMGFASNSDISGTYYRNRGIDVPNYITYMESHDEQWMMYNNIANGNSSGDYNVRELATALERQKMAGALFFTVPGPRMMWQFGELGYGFGDSGEQCLNDGSGSNCPSIAPGRTAEKPVRWDYFDAEQSPNRVDLYKTWSAMINLRQDHEVFRSTSTAVSIAGNSTPQRRITLEHETMDAIVIANVGVTETNVSANFPAAGSWYDFFTGKEVVIEEAERGEGIPMAPGQFHIYTNQPVATPEAGIVPFGVAAPPPGAPTNLSASADLDAGSIALSWTASDAPDVTGYRVYRGTSADFDTTGASIATVAPGTTTFTDDTVTASQTHRYRVFTTDNDEQTSASSNEVTTILYPQEITYSATRSFGQGSRQQDYRLISLPGDVDTGIAETFSGTAGEDWQVYRDNGNAQDFLVEFDGSNAFTFQAGRGFWAIANDAWTVEETVATVSLRTSSDGAFVDIPLSGGWNIISNPLDLDVAWSEVEAANGGALQPIWSFDGSFSEASTFASATSGEAYYFNNTGNLGGLVIPYSAGQQASANASKDPSAYLALTATLADGPDAGTTSKVEAGVSRDAADGVDAADIIAPPPGFEAVSLLVSSGDAAAGARQRLLKRSVQSPDADGHAYDLDLRAEPGTTVELRASNLPSGQSVRLINRVTGESVDLASQAQTEWTVRSENTALTLLTGTEAFVKSAQERLIPDDLTLWPNYPNPFSSQTTIEYTIPKDAHVQLQVYDILGRRVATLVDQRQRSGLHTVQWNGTGGSGQPLASGIYFGRIIVDGQTATRKMTLVR